MDARIKYDRPSEFAFTMSEGLQRRLAEALIYFDYLPEQFTIPIGSTVVARKGAVVEPFCFFGTRSTFEAGCGGFFNSPLTTAASVGRYCSIAALVRVMGDDHPINRITSSGFTYRQAAAYQVMPFRTIGETARIVPFAARGAITLGHDVWIGQDVLLRPGITIGTGAVVAAGSVVVKDVAPYAIVGGNPAKLIRFRFDEALVARLLKSQWWRYSSPQISSMRFEDPASFLDELQEREAAGSIHPYKPEKIDLYQHVLDFYA